MTNTTETRQDRGRRAESAVAQELETVEFDVTNLNDVVGNCPFADLLAHQDSTRLLVQVKGTVTIGGKFGAPPHRVRGLDAIGTALGCHAIYAFVHFTADEEIIRFATAADVAALADEDEAATAGVNRFHVNIHQFDTDVRGLRRLLGRR